VFVNNNNESYNNLKDDLREGEGFEGKEVQSEGWNGLNTIMTESKLAKAQEAYRKLRETAYTVDFIPREEADRLYTLTIVEEIL